MPNLLDILSTGYRTIQLYRMVSGNRFQTDTIVYRVLTNVLVSEGDFQQLNQHQWLGVWDDSAQDYYAYRKEKLSNGKRGNVSMAREIVGLPRGAGYHGDQADHIKGDIRDNTRDSLRVATRLENQVNSKRRKSRSRFKGVLPNGSGFLAKISHDKRRVYFMTVKNDVEAALMYNYAAHLLFGEFANLNEILEDEMPSYERQVQLYGIVVTKLTKVGLLRA